MTLGSNRCDHTDMLASIKKGGRNYQILLLVVRALIVAALAASIWWAFKRYNDDLVSLATEIAGHPFGPFATNLFSTAIWGTLTGLFVVLWSDKLDRWVRRTLVHVNTPVQEHDLDQFRRYAEITTALLVKLLPKDLKEVGGEGDHKIPLLIPIQSQARLSRAPAHRSPHIVNTLSFIEAEYLLTSGEDLDPLLIEGDPGCGKSTMFFEVFRHLRAGLVQRRQGWIPLVLFANKISAPLVLRHRTLETFLVAYFQDRYETEKAGGYNDIAELLRARFHTYRFAIIIDGWDEFTDRTQYASTAIALNALIDTRKTEDLDKKPFDGRHRYFISCRSEDNQEKFSGRVISLRPLEYSQVFRYLRRLDRIQRGYPWWKVWRLGAPRTRARRIKEALEKSRIDGLLQNYVTNPYLLYLITEYYSDRDEPLASRLAEVFEDVLKRELSKVRQDDEGLPRFVRVLLAPYAYLCRSHTFQPGGINEPNFRECLSADATLSNLLLGSSSDAGYLRAVWEKDTRAVETMSARLNSAWGNDERNLFSEHLHSLRDSEPSYEAFCDLALGYLHKRLLSVIEASNLATLRTDGSIDRFRHRRMEHYFMAVYINRVGIGACPYVAGRLNDASLREPLRLLAAIADHPEEVLSLFRDEYDRKAANAETFEDMNLLANLLLNAGSAIAYLPAPLSVPRSDLTQCVLDLGGRAHDLYHRIQNISTHETNVQFRDPQLVREKCLSCLMEIRIISTVS